MKRWKHALIIALFAALAIAPVSAMDPPAAAPISVLLTEGGVGSDAAFEAALKKDGQDPGHAAPKALRALLTSHPIARMSFSQGYAYREGQIELSWFLSDCGLQGEADVVKAALLSGFEGAGMAKIKSPHPRFPLAYGKPLGSGGREQVFFSEPESWTGGDSTTTGIELGWRLVSPPSPAPSLEALLDAVPALKDPRIDAAIIEGFAKHPVMYLSLGGTWTRYYSLSIGLTAKDADGAKALHADVVEVLKTAGYAVTSEDGGRVELTREATGSFAQVAPPNGEHVVDVHVQPES